ncbi:FAD/NAD(P)-binding protein [Donghicola eburneus]|uniref:FAD-dependent urate hydroxylase HpyO/Asp monooxygenase CreE-like FAD/NAD(P)-binding domain-containing protein n=2 Tax=Donghicola eburneus TaxID=393278 RepID=A0A1M4N2G3_9RHOB|nr:FAD/NAD(P)-binding domain-containing protein [Donghicola eburneus]SCM68145.1 hypothetical protein KARMA_2357 [Donghicola eburneus]
MGRDMVETRIAVVGMGPRSLGALEALAARLGNDAAPLSVDCYDPFPACGAGPNFDPEELDLCRLNIPMRDIDIRPPEFTGCSTFAEWLADTPHPDVFPARADLGRYLEARYNALRRSGRLAITHLPTIATELKQEGDLWMLRADDAWHGPYTEVLLSVGQPQVQPDEQLAEWQQHASAEGRTVAQAYPARRLAEEAAGWTGRTVAIRGLALSAFDVLRVLTTAQGGRFEEGQYIASGQEPAQIVPFSLDGLPPFPKPETEALDARFNLSAAETELFSTNIQAAAIANPEQARTLLTEALVSPVIRILTEFGAETDFSAVFAWLETEFSDPGTQETEGPVETLKTGIAMAEGAATPSVGYTVGQVWRKWQDQLRSGYNPAKTQPDTADLIVAFDEGLKRYSYGPPVSSSRELAALIEAGIVTLDHAADPDIALTEGGWTLTSDQGSVEADVMIDAVIASPDLSILRSSLLNGLVDEGKLCPISESLAAETAADAQIIAQDGTRSPGLCLLGRLALGSVVAADSLHDCFGAASHRWAQDVVERMEGKVET